MRNEYLILSALFLILALMVRDDGLKVAVQETGERAHTFPEMTRRVS